LSYWDKSGQGPYALISISFETRSYEILDGLFLGIFTIQLRKATVKSGQVMSVHQSVCMKQQDPPPDRVSQNSIYVVHKKTF
jgi:hypothetical protein